MIVRFLAENYLWIIIAILAVNMTQRKYPGTDKKRRATVYIALGALLLNISAVFVLQNEMTHWLVAVAAIILLVAGFFLRKWVWPFRLHCAGCGKRMDYAHVVGHDDNLCTSCHLEKHPEEKEKAEAAAQEAERKKQDRVQPARIDYSAARTVEDVDWDVWEPTETCVLTYLLRTSDDGKRQILLIDKKRGLGDGLVNVPGGHIEVAETATEAAIREFKEETDMDIIDPEYRGVLDFQFTDGLAMRGHVFTATSWTGTPRETDEARPFWCDEQDLPYEKMWSDDELWLPDMLAGKNVKGVFIFDDRVMLSHKVELLNRPETLAEDTTEDVAENVK
ncbi:8-oxo-dGTP diphosphatase [Parasphaerochaeta coccoides]|uniref:Oxidized purine nucleoside triphosphate hydrolase n=1 Tax=Parasphaerochaeta coccoides (strain ATCC BAA-1237 / DSM 17374 / SPN1) TaxID=760011 RepID=F4GIB5_PARC1|nr:8-oxo-dGTP diphosphatase [Parasphaerochaeta coccoides]AEC01274.1 NUDIX hydrolase [Parasphaerochaeta coccoides DSM 17374]